MYPRTHPFQLSATGEGHAGDFEDISTRTLQSVYIGQNAGKVSSGVGNAFLGFEAGKHTVGGNYNAFMGYQAGATNTNSSYGTMVGAYAGAQNQRGSEVTFVGYRAGEISKDGNQLVAVGAYALRENVSGNGTVAVGCRAGERTLDGYYNTMVGTESGQDNRSGNFNTMVGYRSGRSAFLGNENTYLGAFSGFSNRAGSGNAFIGFRSGQQMMDGDFNVAIGAFSMQQATFASCNIAIGPFAGTKMTNGAVENVLIGVNAGEEASPSRSVLLGALAGKELTGDASVCIGYNVGDGLLYGNCNILIGAGATTFSNATDLGIAIGSVNTFTFTNAISIGNKIENQRQYSILIGSELLSDANNCIILGKTNQVESVTVFRDPISAILKESVIFDGKTKVGISNIEYGNIVVSPCNEVYRVGTIGKFTSNVVSSLTNPEYGKIGPSTYDLRTYVEQHMIHHGHFHGIYSPDELETVQTQPVSVSSAVLSLSPSISISNTYIPDVLTPSSAFHIEHSDPFTANIWNVHVQNTDIPCEIALRHTQPNATTNNQAKTIGTSPLGTTFLPISLSDLHYGVSCNLTNGAFIYSPCNQLRFIVETLPSYGVLNDVFFSSNPECTYTTWAEYGLVTSDTFQVRPYYQITTNEQKTYNIPAEEPMTIQIQFQPAQTEIYSANRILLSNEYVLSSNIFQGASPISPSTPVRFLNLNSNLIVATNFGEFSSNDIELMKEREIQNYPPDQYSFYLSETVTKYASVLTRHSDLSQDLLPVLQDIYSFTTSLYDLAITFQEQTLLQEIRTNAQDAFNVTLFPYPTLLATVTNMDVRIQEWTAEYDPLFVKPYSLQLGQSNTSFQQQYVLNGFYAGWSNTFAYSNAFETMRNNSNALLENVSDFQMLIVPQITYDNETLSRAMTVYPFFATIYTLYFETPRMFVTYKDVIDQTVTIQQNQNTIQESRPYGIWTDGFQVRFDTTPSASDHQVSIRSSSSNNNSWGDVQLPFLACNIVRPWSYNLEPLEIDLQSAYPSIFTYYILQHPQYGFLSNESTNTVTYTAFDVWSSNDSFHLLLENQDGQTADFPVSISYADVRTRITPVPVLYGSEISDVTITSNIHSYQRNAYIACNISVLNGVETQRVAVSPYDPNVGYFYITSNTSYSVTSIEPLETTGPLNITSNIYTTTYNFHERNNTFVTSTLADTISETVQQSPTDLSSNITIDYITTIFSSNLFAKTHITKQIERDLTVTHVANSLNGQFLYSYNEQLTQRSPGNVVITTTSQYAISSELYHDIEYTTLVETTTLSRPFVPITEYHVLFKDTTYLDIPSSSAFSIIQSNVGYVPRIYASDLAERTIFVTSLTPLNRVYNLSDFIFNVIDANGMSETSTSLEVLIPVDTMQGSLTSWMTNIANASGISPDEVYVIDAFHGTIRGEIGAVSYVPRSITGTPDVIRLFLRNSVTKAVSDMYVVDLVPKVTADSRGQAINYGVNTNNILTSLDPRVFFYMFGNLNYNEITFFITDTSHNVVLKAADGRVLSFFSLQEVVDGLVVVDAQADGYFTFDVRNPQQVTLFAGENFIIQRTPLHVAYPPFSAITPVMLFVGSRGTNTYENKFSTYLQTWFDTWISNNTQVGPSSIAFTLGAHTTNGFLINTNDHSKIAHEFTYDDVLNHRIRYIYKYPHRPETHTPEYVTAHISYMDISSEPFSIQVFKSFAHFSPLAIDRSVLLPVTVPYPGGSGWTTTCNITVTPSTPDIYNMEWYSPYLGTETWNIRTYESAQRVDAFSLQTQITVDQADSVSLTTIANALVTPVSQLYPSSEIFVYVTLPPKHGIILNKHTFAQITKCTLYDLQQNNVIYQHVGTEIFADTFSVAIASSPYSIGTQECIVTIEIRKIPKIVTNRTNHVYFASLAQTQSYIPLSSNVLSFTTDPGFVHTISASNLVFVNALGLSYDDFPVTSSFLYGYRVAQNVFQNNVLPYPPSEFTFTMNRHSDAHINPLASLQPYRNAFIHTFTSVTNEFSDQSVIQAEIDPNQAIVYSIQTTPALVISMIRKTTNISFQLYPSPTFIDSAFFQHDSLEILFWSDDMTYLFTFRVRGRAWEATNHLGNVFTGTTPFLLPRFAWNTIRIVNFDPSSPSENMSLYWNDVNIFSSIVVQSLPLEQCTRYEINFNIDDPKMFVGTSNFIRSVSDGLYQSFVLENSQLVYYIRNFEVDVSTYVIDKSNDYNADDHNIIVGKDIFVQGVNNICIGNKFGTSGNQSIIIGNDIGGGEETSINDIFQSIIIGNTSFKNSIVRDIICIGNQNYNGLSAQDVSRTQFFLAQRPIVIGNFADASKIDFHVNIGNVFFSTNVGAKQIYLGNAKEAVVIGASSNESLSSNRHSLHVFGSVRTDSHVSSKCVSQYGISTAMILPYFVVKDDLVENDDFVSPTFSASNTLVKGVTFSSDVRGDGLYDTQFITRGKTKVWCASAVVPGELLVSSHVSGCVIGRGEDTTIHSFTFAKSLASWDPLVPQNTPSIETSNIGTHTIGLIPCVILI